MYGGEIMYQPGFYYPTYISGEGSGGGADNGLPAGGTTGSILMKNSNKDYDASFHNPQEYNIITEVNNITSTSGTIGNKGLYVYYSKTNTFIDFTVNSYKHTSQSLVIKFDVDVENVKNPLDGITTYRNYVQSHAAYGISNSNRYVTFLVYIYNGKLNFEHRAESLDYAKNLNSFRFCFSIPVNIIE